MKRFSRLEHALKLLRRPTDIGDPTATAPAAPAGSALEEYEKFTSRKKFINITRTADSLPKSLIEVALQPFGFPNTAANKTLISYSQRASTALATYGGAATFNHAASVDNSQKRYGFKPAQAVVFDPGGTVTTTPKTSKITGIPYKARGGKSYTFPFGVGTGDDEATEFACRNTIVTIIAGVKANASVSFKAESFKSR